jgi:hypothetical protein
MSIESVTPLEDLDLYIEWPDQEGLVQASLGDNLERLKAESQKAMNITMSVFHVMANRISKAIDAIEDEVRPDEMEVEFSLKLDVEGGSVIPMIAKTTAGGQFNIKFKWAIEKLNRPTVLISESK